ncbi:MAG: CheY-P phosphatase CheX [Candidatus Dichloromethanomonas elyunquensis]|nr:MAG: CheY-P phosphatase CheX [Candidatus Dichloromethanomonas elyunquensis]
MKNTWKDEYINSFLDSFVSVIASIVGDKKIKLEKNIQHSQESPGYKICVNIGFVGDFKGQANFIMGKNTAMVLTSTLAGGMEISEVDDLVKSAIGEFANMVMGGVCTNLSSEEIVLDITPPSIITGEDYQISSLIPQFCSKISVVDIGNIVFDIAIKQD